MREKLETRFGFKEISALRKSFEQKNWDNFPEFEDFFENFCSIYEHLNGDQTELVLDLTNDFLWLREDQYYSLFKSALLKFFKLKHLNFEKVYVVPMLSPKDRAGNKTKSSRVVAYITKNTLFRINKKFKNSKFIIVDNLKHLPNKNKLEENKTPIIIVDDFVGTGETAVDALTEILSLEDYSNKNLYVVSLVSQDKGKKAIEEMGYTLFVDKIAARGISDKFTGTVMLEKKKIMETIEDILATDKKFNNDFRFGFKASEALVSMIRTPNNTFPIYWWNCSLDSGKKWNSPFPR